MTDDRIIWNNFKQGDKSALSQIYSQNIKILYRFGKKITRNDELIKDTIQELFCDLIRTRKNLQSIDNIKFYLLKSFRRKLLREIGSLKKPPFTDEFDEYSEVTIIYPFEEELISKESKTQREELILNALNEISPKQREILYYRFTCEFEYEQICEIMSMKYDSARKMVHRALTSLKAVLESNFQLKDYQ
jgi:RNA polymerase sigma factor (sigma-70 family)